MDKGYIYVWDISGKMGDSVGVELQEVSSGAAARRLQDSGSIPSVSTTRMHPGHDLVSMWREESWRVEGGY